MYIFTKSRPNWGQKIDWNIISEFVKFKVGFIVTSQESSANNFLLWCHQQCAVTLRVTAHIICLVEYTFYP